ncbi:MAG: hypothetical protein FD163_2347 [Hyphomonadaceae bacterium]|nr:MAG: hypothetical protein FD163_2347 [Hyphomonadaceae bacterium]
MSHFAKLRLLAGPWFRFKSTTATSKIKAPTLWTPLFWVRGQDFNQRSSGYEPDKLGAKLLFTVNFLLLLCVCFKKCRGLPRTATKNS